MPTARDTAQSNHTVTNSPSSPALRAPDTTQTRYAVAAPARPHVAHAGVAALLSLGVAAIHVVDQGGFTALKTPTYVGIGYYVLEIVAVLVAVALVRRRTRLHPLTWLAAAAVAAGPLAGYVLSRGPGLPGYGDDRGNWTEPLGLISLAVEGVLLVLALVGARAARAQQTGILQK